MAKAHLFALVFALCAPAMGVDLGDEMPLADFIPVVEGKYDILKADGDKPKAENATGAVDNETDELVFTFGYCPKDAELCDPGYVFLPKKAGGGVTVYQKDIKTAVLYTIVHKDGLDEYKYEFEIPTDPKESTIYRRLGYSYAGNAPFTLVFEIQKQPPPAP